jgi:hypothetical protein
MPTLRFGKVWQVIRHFGVLFWSLPDAAIWWCLWTGGGGILTSNTSYNWLLPLQYQLSPGVVSEIHTIYQANT